MSSCELLTAGLSQFRPSGRSNRSGRSQADHDVFEGLPIKQWRQSESTIGFSQVIAESNIGDNAFPELPLPRDSHLLAPWTQAILREARRPRLAKRKEPVEDEKGEEEEDGEKETQSGFLAKKWTQVPAHLEEPEREYLAKRRKGLPSLHATLALQSTTNMPSTAPTRKAKIVQSDAEGHKKIYEVLIPEGQVIDNEVQQDSALAEAAPEKAAPGTVVEGVGIANAEGVIVANDLLQPPAPPRRRNMPPKRVKKGGPGRGKKKVQFTGEDPNSAATPGGTGAPSTPATGDGGTSEAMELNSTRKDIGDGEDGEDDDEEDDDREDGEVSEGEAMAPETPSALNDFAMMPEANDPPVPTETAKNTQEESQPAKKSSMLPNVLHADKSNTEPVLAGTTEESAALQNMPISSPDLPLSTGHSRQGSLSAQSKQAPNDNTQSPTAVLSGITEVLTKETNEGGALNSPEKAPEDQAGDTLV